MKSFTLLIHFNIIEIPDTIIFPWDGVQIYAHVMEESFIHL